MIRALIRGGMNAARFNFSHGTHEEQLARLQMFTGVRDSMSFPVATVLDTKGPEIRIRSFATKTVVLAAGSDFTLTAEDIVGDETRVSVTYENLPAEVQTDQMILIDDGLVGIKVREIKGNDILCTVVNGGTLSANKSINSPGAKIDLPSLTEKDIDDIRFGIEHDFDFIAASFIRRASDVEAIREVLCTYGGEKIQIIAKIENQEGVDNLDEIMAVADGIMVARGDLGVEIPAAEVPVLQKQMIRKGLHTGKLVVTATQMLDSMMRNPRPTRAEISDVANAVFDGTSCVMLSGETASGKYPLEALEIMVRTLEAAEDAIDYRDRFIRQFELDRQVGSQSIDQAISHTCCMTAIDLNASAILAATFSGHSARMISRFRPPCPIIGLTTSEKGRRQMSISFGVHPLLYGAVDSTDRLFSLCVECSRKEGLVQKGETVVITAGVPLSSRGTTNLIKVQVV